MEHELDGKTYMFREPRRGERIEVRRALYESFGWVDPAEEELRMIVKTVRVKDKDDKDFHDLSEKDVREMGESLYAVISALHNKTRIRKEHVDFLQKLGKTETETKP